MNVKTEAERQQLQAIGRIVADVLQRMGASLQPGMTTAELDQLGQQWLSEAGARSAPKLAYNFPGATCISVNEAVAHGIPGALKLQPGDLVNIDVSAEKNGFFADTGASFCVTPVSPARQRLCQAGQEILAAAIQVARAGLPLNGIGKVIQAEARARGYSVIRNLGSHGVGRALHEDPEFIAPYDNRKDRRKLRAGTVITIEPFISTGAESVYEAKDGWTLCTAKRFDTVQYEHSLIITETEPLILTQLSPPGILSPPGSSATSTD
ncbi:MAG: type I methionyl aminopeptidase [Candidatus Sericytochromatia bacterium]|nr:type I methionyl aminopeptidase [Candidatus Sericytochromatia bacterium]